MQVDVNGFLAQVGDTDANFVNLSTTITAHELGHTLGLRHEDAIGPIGLGVSNPPALTSYFPTYDGLVGAFTTVNDIMASPASVGSTLANAASGQATSANATRSSWRSSPAARSSPGHARRWDRDRDGGDAQATAINQANEVASGRRHRDLRVGHGPGAGRESVPPERAQPDWLQV